MAVGPNRLIQLEIKDHNDHRTSESLAELTHSRAKQGTLQDAGEAPRVPSPPHLQQPTAPPPSRHITFPVSDDDLIRPTERTAWLTTSTTALIRSHR
jgi:hypothetical protein